MGRLARVLESIKGLLGADNVTDIKSDPGGNANVTGFHLSSPGDDSLPLNQDITILVPIPGSGRDAAIAYADPKNSLQSEPGEKRIYSRDADGVQVAAIKLSKDGKILVSNSGGGSIELQPGGDIVLNGVTIDTNGNIETGGNLDAGGDIDSGGTISALTDVSVGITTLKTHVHTGVTPGGGVSGPPPP